jgi:outer membrane biosynthesis protein TonB
MSGDNPRQDDPDFLDDEFVIEGLSDAEPQDDLDQLFALPPQAGETPQPPADDAAAAEELFTDHTAEIEPTQTFGAEQPQFAEDAPSQWNGNELELDDPSTTPAAFAPTTDAESAEPMEFALDGAEEPWQAEAAAGAPEDFLGLAGQQDDETSGEFADEAAESDAQAGEDDAAPAADADEYEPAPEEEYAAVDGGAEAPVYEFAPSRGSRFAVVMGSIAATLALVAGAAVVVMRPQWLGIETGGTKLTVAKVERPHVDVELAMPAVVAVAPTEPTPIAPTPVEAQPAPSQPVANAEPVVAPQPVAIPTPPAATVEPTVVPQPVATVTAPVVAPTPAPAQPAPVAVVPPTPVATPTASQPSTQPVAATPVVAWPVARGAESPTVARARKSSGTLVRVGEDTMLGEADASAAERRAVDGVIPGVRAFAQLRNGNFFIGAVKSVDDERVTLRTAEGEVTIGKVDLARLTGLGTSDYEALQKATEGFVRLTNSNKLVGGILSQIADDHVVLEFRSNRVILPRSAVGEVVAGQAAEGVRLGVTSEEDDWVRTIAEREIGKPKEPAKAKPAGGK